MKRFTQPAAAVSSVSAGSGSVETRLVPAVTFQRFDLDGDGVG